MRIVSLGGALLEASRYKIRRSLRVAPRSLAEVASRSWVIAPGVEELFPPTYVPESHLDRIVRGAPPELKTPAQSRDEVIGLKGIHVGGPTTAVVLRDAFLLGSNCYCGMHKEDLYTGSDVRSLLRGDWGEVPQAVLATSYAGARWYGHVLIDDLPLQELAPTVGLPIGHVRPKFPHEAGWRSALQIPEPRPYSVLRARELVFIDDRGQNLAKRRRYQKIRAQLSNRPRGHERIFLARKTSGGGEKRGLVNEAEIEQRLASEGFHIVDTSTVTVEEMLQRCAGASVIVSIEGSHSAPAYYFAGDGACVMFLYPPGRVGTNMTFLASFFGLFGAMFICEPVEGADPAQLFRADPDELMREVDEASKRARLAASTVH